MNTYQHVGDIFGLDGKWRPAFRCVDCGALVDTIAEHDTYHAKVDAMYRAVVPQDAKGDRELPQEAEAGDVMEHFDQMFGGEEE